MLIRSRQTLHRTQFVFLSLVFFLAFGKAFAGGQRFPLTNNYSRVFLNKVVKQDFSWIDYPVYNDRQAWANIPEATRHEVIEKGEQYLEYDWPVIKATDYLEFTRTGDRRVVDVPVHLTSDALDALLMAELVEGKGRFLDDLINGAFTVCERTFWGGSAHFYLYDNNTLASDPTTIFPDHTRPIIDLFAGEIGVKLAWIYYFLHDEFDKITPVISSRLKHELQEKILNPYYQRNDFWWMFGRASSGSVNNWNPDCNYHALLCILLMEDDPDRKLFGVYKSMSSVDIFINHYQEDGACSEGPGYWRRAVGNMFNYLELLNKVTDGKINIFKDEKIREMARYIYRVYISEGIYYTNYADASARIKYNPDFIYRIGAMIEDEPMMSFAAFLAKRSENNGTREPGSLKELVHSVKWEAKKPVEPLISDFYFPDWDVVIARDKAGTTNGFYFSAKGGTNGEQHNHNDVGSFMLYYNGDPVFIDLGVGTYTKDTFSPRRYSIWTMQSNFHNLPIINGNGQERGGNHRANESRYKASDSSISFSTDISKAYGEEAAVKSWTRSYELKRGKHFRINDQFNLEENNGNTSVNFMTSLPCKVVQPGIIELKGDDFTLHFRYDPSQLEEQIEVIPIDDGKLERSVGSKKVNRLVFKWKASDLSGAFSFYLDKI